VWLAVIETRVAATEVFMDLATSKKNRYQLFQVLHMHTDSFRFGWHKGCGWFINRGKGARFQPSSYLERVFKFFADIGDSCMSVMRWPCVLFAPFHVRHA
jgi:hypothetical protein